MGKMANILWGGKKSIVWFGRYPEFTLSSFSQEEFEGEDAAA
jgi:hypothetical protein